MVPLRVRRVQRVFEGDFGRGFSLTERARGWDEALPVTGYQPLWSLRFAIEARVLREALQPLRPEIEHVGSTAVPGLAARPIIDIALGMQQPGLIGVYLERLRNFGFLLVPEPYEGQPTFVRREHGIRTHRLMLAATGSRAWQALLELRDRLRARPELAADYAQIKVRAGAAHTSLPSAYRAAKAEFFRRMLPVNGADAAAAPLAPSE